MNNEVIFQLLSITLVVFVGPAIVGLLYLRKGEL